MAPIFELAVSDINSPESIKNARTLSERFLEIGIDGDRFRIRPSNNNNNEFMTLTNHHDEELYIYPESEEWSLNKEVDLLESSFNLLGKVNIIPFWTNKGEIRVLMTDNNFERTLVLPLIDSRSFSHLYGRIDPSMFPERGDFFKDKEQYIQAIELLERITDLEVKDFFIRVRPPFTDLNKTGEIRDSEVQLAIDLK